jgi:hypothetical protein
VVARDLHVPPLEARLPVPSITRICVMFLSFFFYLIFFLKKKSYLGICFCLWETTAFEFVIVTLFTAVLFLVPNNIVTVSTIL